MNNERFKNPINKLNLVLWSLFIIAYSIISVIWGSVEDGFDWSMLAIVIPIGLVPFAIVFWGEVIRKPKTVEVTVTGIFVQNRFRIKQEFVPWERISKLVIRNKSSSSNIRIRSENRNYYLFISEKRFFIIHYPIAKAIITAYSASTGRDIPAE